MAITIISAAPAQPEKKGLGEDVARSGFAGLQEAAATTGGVFGDLRRLAEAGADKAAHVMGQDHAPLRMNALNPAEMVTGFAGAQLKKHGVDPRVASLASILMPGGFMASPSSGELLDAIRQGKPGYQPQTKVGEYVRTGAALIPAAVLPGGPARRIANVAVPALASETAGQMTKGSAVEPYARVLAGVLGAGGVAAVGRARPDTRLLAEASRGATDAHIAQARQLMEQGQQQGVRLTLAEALQQVTNAGTGMGRLQRVVEGTRAGTERIGPVMAERPAQVRGAITSYADTIAPPTPNPSMLGAQAQESAETALNGVRQGINEQARPFYDRLPGDELPMNDYQALAADPSYSAALAQLRAHPELGARIAGLPDNDLSVVNDVVKRLNTAAEQVRPGPMNVQGADNTLAALRDTAAGTARDVASRASPDFAAARQIVADGRAANLEPLQRGPLGRIAGTDDLTAQTGALFPGQPVEGAAAETAQALQMMGGPVSDAGRGLVRQHLVNSANEATQALQSGPNQWGGAKWAATQAGNPEQERALMAGVDAVGGNTGNLQSLVEVLRATGKRQPPGSLTAYNARDLEELGKAGVMGEALRTGLNPPGVFRRIGQGFQDWQTENNAGRLADAILANPADAERILVRARAVVPQGRELETIERLALAAQQSRQIQAQGQ